MPHLNRADKLFIKRFHRKLKQIEAGEMMQDLGQFRCDVTRSLSTAEELEIAVEAARILLTHADTIERNMRHETLPAARHRRGKVRRRLLLQMMQATAIDVAAQMVDQDPPTADKKLQLATEYPAHVGLLYVLKRHQELIGEEAIKLVPPGKSKPMVRRTIDELAEGNPWPQRRRWRPAPLSPRNG